MKNQLKEYKIIPTKNNYEIPKKTINNSIDAFEFIKQFWNEDIEVYESVFILLLNRSNKTIGWAKISQGGIASSLIETKLICKYVVDSLASSIILCHNHPSGNKNPSKHDIEITKKIIKALEFFDCKVIDHIIITPEYKFTSLAENGLI